MLENLEQEHFKQLEQLSKISEEISSAKVTLIEAKKNVEEFYKKREIEANEKLKDFLAKSKDLIEEINANYEKVQKFYAEIHQSNQFISEFNENIKDLIAKLSKDTEEFDKFISENTERLTSWQKELEIKEKEHETKQKTLQSQQELIKKELKLLASREKTLQASYKALEKQWKK